MQAKLFLKMSAVCTHIEEKCTESEYFALNLRIFVHVEFLSTKILNLSTNYLNNFLCVEFNLPKSGLQRDLQDRLLAHFGIQDDDDNNDTDGVKSVHRENYSSNLHSN